MGLKVMVSIVNDFTKADDIFIQIIFKRNNTYGIKLVSLKLFYLFHFQLSATSSIPISIISSAFQIDALGPCSGIRSRSSNMSVPPR
jgi:hypothetical protein